MTNAEMKEMYALGMTALQHADFPSAIEFFGAVVSEDPANGDAWLHLGVCYLETQQPDLALEALTRSVHTTPENADAHHVLGTAYGTVGQLERAASCFRQALELNPQHTKADEFLVRTESLLESREHFRNALKLLSSPSPTVEELNQALRDLVQSMAIFPESPARENLLDCARKLFALKRECEVKVKYEPGMEPWMAACERGYQCVRFGNWLGVQHAYGSALEFRAFYAFVHHALGFSAAELGNLDDAVRAWLRVLELEPGYDFSCFGHAQFADWPNGSVNQRAKP
jgi:tetratricopeptide (TPR) repeat protein